MVCDLLTARSSRILWLVGLMGVAGCTRAPSVSGMWDATVSVGSTVVPFRFAIEGGGADLKGSFFNGDDRISSTTARIQGDTIVFNYPEYGARLTRAWPR